MATVTGLTAERMLEIEGASVISGEIVGDNLILTKFDETTVDAGYVRGPQGPMGLGPGMIPGEVRLWSGSILPDPDDYATWVWANGAAYLAVEHPLADTYIDDAWRTFDGAADPGAGYFRVPDLRGLVPAGLDQMPSGAAAGRLERAVAIVLAGVSGEEEHIITVPEMPSHNHPFIFQNINLDTSGDPYVFFFRDEPDTRDDLIGDTGGDEAHENIQPTVFIPYIVCLDG